MAYAMGTAIIRSKKPRELGLWLAIVFGLLTLGGFFLMAIEVLLGG